MSAEDREELEKEITLFFESARQVYGCKLEGLRNFVSTIVDAYEQKRVIKLDVRSPLEERARRIIHIARSLNRDSLGEMRVFVEEKKRQFRKVFLVDCLGLPEFYHLWCTAVERGLHPALRVFVNTGADTKTFKERFGQEAETLYIVAQELGAQVFRGLDRLLHELHSNTLPRDRLISLIAQRALYASQVLSSPHGGVLILTDHGYDVVREGKGYRALHGEWALGVKLALAKLALALLVKV